MFTLKTALEYGNEGKIEEWIHLVMRGDEGGNVELSDGLKLFNRHFYGPVKMKLSTFKRVCGPEEDMEFVIPIEDFNRNVANIVKRYESGWDMPPLIIQFDEGEFCLCDGNHRHEALTRLSVEEYYVIVWATQKTDLDAFLEKYISTEVES